MLSSLLLLGRIFSIDPRGFLPLSVKGIYRLG